MASSIVLTIQSDETQAFNKQILQLSSTQNKEMARNLSSLFKAMSGGAHRATVDVQTGSAAPVAASGTLTLVSVIATDVITIGPVTFTFTSSPSVETDIEVDGATDTDDAAAAVAAINLHSTVGQVVLATNVAGVITLTALQEGVVGNFVSYGSVDSTITAAAANLTSGAGGVTEAATTANLGL